MTLEDFIAKLNAMTFWGEFTFSETKFFPRPKQQVELADGLVKMGPLALVLQLKERTEETTSPDVERRWFRGKVLRKATGQIKDTLRYISENDEIRLTNNKGHKITLKGSELEEIKKIVVFLPGRALPNDCWNTKFHISASAGFIHIIAANDYLGIAEKLRVPDDVRLYLDYRESVLPRLKAADITVEEPDIMVAFLSEKDLPAPGSVGSLRSFVQDLDNFDLSPILRDIQSHIVNPERNTDYYKILEEFARVPRSVWREFKTRLVKCLDASRDGQACRPFRFSFPRTDCTFMVASMDPDWPATGTEGTRMRSSAVSMFTAAAKYDLKTKVGVGLLISKDGQHFQLDWCVINEPWTIDKKMDSLLRDGSLFRPATEKTVDSFLFHKDQERKI